MYLFLIQVILPHLFHVVKSIEGCLCSVLRKILHYIMKKFGVSCNNRMNCSLKLQNFMKWDEQSRCIVIYILNLCCTTHRRVHTQTRRHDTPVNAPISVQLWPALQSWGNMLPSCHVCVLAGGIVSVCECFNMVK